MFVATGKREILVRELMHLVEKVKLLEKQMDKAVNQAYPAFKRMLMVDGADQIQRLSHGIHYDFHMNEKKVTIGGMGFSSIDVELPQQELFYSFNGTDANTDDTVSKFFDLLSILTQMASIRTMVQEYLEMSLFLKMTHTLQFTELDLSK